MIDPHLAPPPDARLPSAGRLRALGTAAVLLWMGIIAAGYATHRRAESAIAAARIRPPGPAPQAMPPPSMGTRSEPNHPPPRPPEPPPPVPRP